MLQKDLIEETKMDSLETWMGFIDEQTFYYNTISLSVEKRVFFSKRLKVLQASEAPERFTSSINTKRPTSAKAQYTKEGGA